VPGKYGSALAVAPGLQNWGQIFAAPLPIDAPGTTGFTVAAWIKVTDDAGGRGGKAIERMFDNVDLYIWGKTVSCVVNNGAAKAEWSVYNSYLLGTEAAPTIGFDWHHYACAYGEGCAVWLMASKKLASVVCCAMTIH